MRVLIFGGTGFVGLNIATALLARGHAVTLFDCAGLPPAAEQALTRDVCKPDVIARLKVIQGNVLDRQAVADVVVAGCDAIVLGAAITAGAERDAIDPETILQVNLLSQTPILQAARCNNVKRIINLSSAAAYGASGSRNGPLDEETACDPWSLYAITKFASEKVAARLAALWQLDVISVRLSGVFGPWERATGVRDTLSPQMQIFAAMRRHSEAILPRPGLRDWIYAPDVADAVTLLIEASSPQHRLYNISIGAQWTALQWGQHLSALHPGFVCRLNEPNEALTIDLHAPIDRAPLSTARLAQEFGWRARFGCHDSADDLNEWWSRYGEGM